MATNKKKEIITFLAAPFKLSCNYRHQYLLQLELNYSAGHFKPKTECKCKWWFGLFSAWGLFIYCFLSFLVYGANFLQLSALNVVYEALRCDETASNSPYLIDLFSTQINSLDLVQSFVDVSNSIVETRYFNRSDRFVAEFRI